MFGLLLLWCCVLLSIFIIVIIFVADSSEWLSSIREKKKNNFYTDALTRCNRRFWTRERERDWRKEKRKRKWKGKRKKAKKIARFDQRKSPRDQGEITEQTYALTQWLCAIDPVRQRIQSSDCRRHWFQWLQFNVFNPVDARHLLEIDAKWTAMKIYDWTS